MRNSIDDTPERCAAEDKAIAERAPKVEFSASQGPEYFLDVVCDGPPGPECRLVEVEDFLGHSNQFGEWLEREDGCWALRLPLFPDLRAEVERLKAELAALKPAPPTCGECGARVCLTCGRKGLHPVPCPECGMGWSACFPTCRECGAGMHQEAAADGPRLFCPDCGCKP